MLTVVTDDSRSRRLRPQPKRNEPTDEPGTKLGEIPAQQAEGGDVPAGESVEPGGANAQHVG